MEIETVKIQGEGYLVNGTMSVPKADGNRDYQEVKIWLESNIPEPEFTEDELLKQIEDEKPKIVTMRQARLALLQSGLLATIESAIANSDDESMKIEWEYATEVNRNWESLIALISSIGTITENDIDNLFLLASEL